MDYISSIYSYIVGTEVIDDPPPTHLVFTLASPYVTKLNALVDASGLAEEGRDIEVIAAFFIFFVAIYIIEYNIQPNLTKSNSHSWCVKVRGCGGEMRVREMRVGEMRFWWRWGGLCGFALLIGPPRPPRGPAGAGLVIDPPTPHPFPNQPSLSSPPPLPLLSPPSLRSPPRSTLSFVQYSVGRVS